MFRNFQLLILYSNLIAYGGQILIEETLRVRTLILNRPRQLNSLLAEMILQLLKMFKVYEEDCNVNLVIVKGNGRAFCAGGDLSILDHVVTRGQWSFGAAYFYKVYTLNYILATYTKPQVSLLNGIVMGGGAGLSMHGKFRVVTENAVFAMPETALGLFPDVGASYFVSRLPGFYGEYLGLTGAKLDGSEMLACGLATHFVCSKRLPLLEEALYQVDTTDPAVVSAIVDRFSQKVPLKNNSSYQRLHIIDQCFSKETVEEILSALETEAHNGNDEWLADTILLLKKASPMSLKISLRAIRKGRFQGVDQCLIQDYRICCHVLRREVSNDFFEGYRALLKGKDRNSKWEPSKLELITKEMVNKYFTEVDDYGWEDLKFPTRHNLGISARAKL